LSRTRTSRRGYRDEFADLRPHFKQRTETNAMKTAIIQNEKMTSTSMLHEQLALQRLKELHPPIAKRKPAWAWKPRLDWLWLIPAAMFKRPELVRHETRDNPYSLLDHNRIL
jgi:hypothetical protein